MCKVGLIMPSMSLYSRASHSGNGSLVILSEFLLVQIFFIGSIQILQIDVLIFQLYAEPVRMSFHEALGHGSISTSHTIFFTRRALCVPGMKSSGSSILMGS
jgi:hypothetical protein